MTNNFKISQLVERLVGIIEQETAAKAELLDVAGKIFKLSEDIKHTGEIKEGISTDLAVPIPENAVISPLQKTLFENDVKIAMDYIKDEIKIQGDGGIEINAEALENDSPLRTRLANQINVNLTNTEIGRKFDNETWIEQAIKTMNYPSNKNAFIEILRDALALRNTPRI